MIMLCVMLCPLLVDGPVALVQEALQLPNLEAQHVHLHLSDGGGRPVRAREGKQWIGGGGGQRQMKVAESARDRRKAPVVTSVRSIHGTWLADM